MKSIYLRSHEVRRLLALKAGETMKIYREIKPQPDAKSTCLGPCTGSLDKKKLGIFAFAILDETGKIINQTLNQIWPPCRPGHTVAGRETWDVPYNEHTGYAYKASCGPEALHLFAWKSPVTMPADAVRCWVRVEDMRAIEDQDITEEGAVTIWKWEITATRGESPDADPASHYRH